MTNRLRLTPDMKDTIDLLTRRELLYYTSVELLLTYWKVIKLITLLSIIDTINNVMVERRKGKADVVEGENPREIVKVPTSIDNQNKYVRRVYVLDQDINYYMFPHKSMKGHYRLVMYLFEVALVNSWILYKIQSETTGAPDSPVSFLTYRRVVGKELIHEQAGTKNIPQTTQKVHKTKERIVKREDSLELESRCHLGEGYTKNIQ